MNQKTGYVLDCERMKYANTGLYHYCLQLGKAIQRNLQSEEELKLYVRAATAPDFGDGYSFINQHSLHKFFMPVPAGTAVWHCTYQGSNYFPYRKKLPVILTIHDLNFLYDEFKSAAKQKKYINKLKNKINNSSHIVAISHFVLNDIKANFEIKDIPCSVIYNGCNISESTLPELPRHKQPTQPFLYTIGTVVDKKNFHVLPALLVGNNRQLIISGIIQSENYKAKILEAANQIGVAERLVFTGAVSEAEKYWYMLNCEAFLFPSIAEGFGLPVVEAMYFGKPVILSTHTSLPEIGGEAAYYFTDFDPGNMRETLAQSLLHYKNNASAEFIKQRAAMFNWDTAATEYLKIYRSLVK
jgi:glycosyltransferase involved in cell wall biosynthesis